MTSTQFSVWPPAMVGTKMVLPRRESDKVSSKVFASDVSLALITVLSCLQDAGADGEASHSHMQSGIMWTSDAHDLSVVRGKPKLRDPERAT
jgi:hypothetical protein